MAGARAVLGEANQQAPGPSTRPAGYKPPAFTFNRKRYREDHKAEAAATHKAWYHKNKFHVAGLRAVNRINNGECLKNLNEIIDKHNIRIGANGKAFIARVAESENDYDSD